MFSYTPLLQHSKTSGSRQRKHLPVGQCFSSERLTGLFGWSGRRNSDEFRYVFSEWGRRGWTGEWGGGGGNLSFSSVADWRWAEGQAEIIKGILEEEEEGWW